MTLMPFRERLGAARPVIIDGPVGTELDRRGVATTLPLWSARALIDAPEVIRSVHRDYVDAGAEILTANTFRTHERSLAAGGIEGQAAELTLEAVEIAREIAGDIAWVAGSQAPLEDCYAPHLTPDDIALRAEHEEMAHNLAASGVDIILVETQNNVREAIAATRAAAATGLPVLTSFVCGPDGRLLSGETLREAVHAVLPFEPAALLINCAPAPMVTGPLATIHREAPDLPFGAYANVGHADPEVGWVHTDAVDPEAYVAYADEWLRLGATLIGSCCGTTPRHTEALHRRIEALHGRTLRG